MEERVGGNLDDRVVDEQGDGEQESGTRRLGVTNCEELEDYSSQQLT